MDTKNVIAAISLSAAVIILYSLFFAPPPKEINNLNQEKTVLNSEAPKLDSSDKFIEISREDAIKESERVKFENKNIKGSISLLGGTIDDLVFKNVKKNYKNFIVAFFLHHHIFVLQCLHHPSSTSLHYLTHYYHLI